MNKDQSFQVFRGIAIVAVVAIHTTGSISASANSFEMLTSVMLRQFINFAVPMFLFISGYFSVKPFNSRKDYFLFLENRLTRLLIPYIIWSTAGLILLKRLGEIDALRIAVLFLTGQSVGPYYYIIVLLQLTLITPLLIKAVESKFLSTLVLLLNIGSLLALYVINASFGGLSFPWYALPCTVWIVFYQWGIYARMKLENAWFYRQLPTFLFCLLLCLALSVLESQYIYENWGDTNFAASQIKISSFAFSFCLINILMGLRTVGIKSHLMSWLGDFSFGIYLAHIFVLYPMIALCRQIPLIQTSLLALTLISASLTIALCVALSLLAKKLLGKKASATFLGM